ncbi:MAG: aminotransferase class III-fold pyridoxal phosphate-dependent enzyme [Spirochaetales bacterium]|nr:aminotransferase class III-fold pyridoxal phosphate-dependent enzyme [Spirochaetales bacterium]
MEHHGFSKSVELFKRAAKVIPGGIYGPKSPAFVIPGSYPYYFSKGKGCRLYDVDGNEYIDFMCGYGSQILGYCYEPVDKEAIRQIKEGDLLNGPQPMMVSLAETLVEQISGMDWAVFTKNGTDSTTLAVSLARVHTGKKKIILAKGAYHGSANWCSSNDYPVLSEKTDILTFSYNNTEELESLFKTHRGEIAAIILTPYHHPSFAAQVMPGDTFYPTVERLIKAEGALFILDDIRCNFRLSLEGSHSFFGCQPDLLAMGKSAANGQPISILMGTDALRKTAGSFFITGTFWMSGMPFAAALSCLKAMKELDILSHMNRVGTLLREGLTDLGKAAGFDILMSGPPAIPFMMFKGDEDLYLNQIFCSEMTRRGVYLHPHHNWFISWAHKEEDIEQTLTTAQEAFTITAAAVS